MESFGGGVAFPKGGETEGRDIEGVLRGRPGLQRWLRRLFRESKALKGRVPRRRELRAKEKGSSRATPARFVVAGEGFEPSTFGL